MTVGIYIIGCIIAFILICLCMINIAVGLVKKDGYPIDIINTLLWCFIGVVLSLAWPALLICLPFVGISYLVAKYINSRGGHV